MKYLGQGLSAPDSTIMDLQPSGLFKAPVDGRTVRFQLHAASGKPVVHDYVGSLGHPDFRFPLAEIIPESEQDLDSLYSQGGIVVVGCDPANYHGVRLAQGRSRRRRAQGEP